MPHSDHKSGRTAEFIGLFSAHSRRILWLIRTAVPSSDAADEVFQETSAALWEKFDEFQPGTNFVAWASQIACYKVLTFRQKQARDRRVFSDALVEELLADSGPLGDGLDDRRRWLADCLAHLSESDRDLVARRYKPDVSSKQISQQMGKSESYISKALARIHLLLFECISRHAAGERETR